MPGGPLCTIGPLSAIRTTSVFSAMPSLLSSLIKAPIRTSSGVISSAVTPPLVVSFFGEGRKEPSAGHHATKNGFFAAAFFWMKAKVRFSNSPSSFK